MRFQILITPETAPRGKALLQALHESAHSKGIKSEIFSCYQQDKDSVLMLYGMGGPDRYPFALQHMQQGGRLVVWDAGYWDRKLSNDDRKYRVSVDGLHPQKFVMKGASPGPQRFNESKPKPVSRSRTNKYLLLAGNGPKSNAIGAEGWTAAKSREIRHAFPGQLIAHRPKPKKPQEPGVSFDLLSTGDIHNAVSESSLVVCRHSNVAIDACLQGVPVVCDDGAAAAIYPNKLENYSDQPSKATRQDFLNRLAWWQYSTKECRDGLVWPWLIEVLSAH